MRSQNCRDDNARPKGRGDASAGSVSAWTSAFLRRVTVAARDMLPRPGGGRACQADAARSAPASAFLTPTWLLCTLSSPLTKSMGAPFEQQKNPTGRRCDSFVRRKAQAQFDVASHGTTGIFSTGC